MQPYIKDLLKYKAVRLSSTPPQISHPCLCVKKGNERGRFILNCRKLNQLCPPPPPAKIPHIREVINKFLCAKFVLLPQSDGAVWIDNIFSVGQTKEQCMNRYRRFRERCSIVGVELNDEEDHGVPLQHFKALGMEFDVTAKPKNRMDPKWVDKSSAPARWDVVLSGVCTVRELYRVFGGVVWQMLCCKGRLCTLRRTLLLISEVAKQIETKAEWDYLVEIPTMVRLELSKQRAVIRTNTWTFEEPTNTIAGWSNASSGEWAAVIEGDTEMVCQGKFPAGDVHIFVKELLAAISLVLLAVNHTKVTPCRFILHIDSAVVACIERGQQQFRGQRIA